MKKFIFLLPLFALGCGGGGGATPSFTLVGGTWEWVAFETPAGTRTGCTATPQPSPCGSEWGFTTTQFVGNGNRYTLVGNTLTFYEADGVTVQDTTTVRWIAENEFAERRPGNTDWEVWTRNP